jgi:pSer/pThr/pTyr-binding forkhead associated (FHA) protein
VDGAVILGRAAQGDEENQPQVSLNDYGAQALGVSRQHVALLGRKWGIRVVDLRSKNGTYLNGAKLPPYQERILRDGDELRLGHMVVTVRFVE